MALPLTVSLSEPSGQVPPPRPGPRTALRPLSPSHAPSLGWLLDPEVRRYMPDSPKSAERIAQFTAWVDRQAGITRNLSMVITIGPDVIGLVQGSATEPSGKTIEWGFALKRGRWGEGLMQEAGRAFLRHAVEQASAWNASKPEPRSTTGGPSPRCGAWAPGVNGSFPGGLADKTTDCYLWSLRADDVRQFASTDNPGLRPRLTTPSGVVLPWPAHRNGERTRAGLAAAPRRPATEHRSAEGRTLGRLHAVQPVLSGARPRSPAPCTGRGWSSAPRPAADRAVRRGAAGRDGGAATRSGQARAPSAPPDSADWPGPAHLQ